MLPVIEEASKFTISTFTIYKAGFMEGFLDFQKSTTFIKYYELSNYYCLCTRGEHQECLLLGSAMLAKFMENCFIAWECHKIASRVCQVTSPYVHIYFS